MSPVQDIRCTMTKSDGIDRLHCVKSVQVRRYFWSIFSCIQSVFFRIRTEYGEILSRNTGKYGPKITPYLDTFHAMLVCKSIKAAGKEI